jgi:hypothetical protein
MLANVREGKHVRYKGPIVAHSDPLSSQLVSPSGHNLVLYLSVT